MRHRLFYLVVILLFSVGFAMAVSNPKPKLSVIFNEQVLITTVNLTDSQRLNLTINLIESGQFEQDSKIKYKFVYQPQNNLKEDSYNFSVTAQDTVGNNKTISLNFTIVYSDLGILLIEPNFGVTNNPAIDIVVSTKRTAECRYSEKTPTFSLMTRFEHTDDITHEKLNYILQNTDTTLYVTCNDIGYNKLYSSIFYLLIDKENPVIDSVSVTPAAIYEGIPPFRFNITVKTNELTTCSYTGSENDNGNFEDNFNKTHNKTITVNFDEYNYVYNIICEDRVGYLSAPLEVKFLTNTKVPIDIILVKPTSWTSVPSVDIIVDTTKKALCTLDNRPFPEDITYRHEQQLTLPESVSTIKVECTYAKSDGNPDTISKSFNIMVDRTTPSEPVVDDTSSLKDYPEFSYSLNSLYVKFRSSDSGSGIVKFNVSLILDKDGSVIYNTLTDAGDCTDFVCSNEIDVQVELKNQTKYKFSVKAIDNAGLVSKEVFSNGVTIDTSKKPLETTPPSVVLVKQKVDRGINVSIKCTDTGTEASGCDNSSYKYSVANKKEECRLAEYIITGVVVTETSWFCWEVADKAGNKANGAEQIKLEINDSDKDSIPIGTDNCPDVANPEQKDADEDGIGDECDNCLAQYNPSQADKDSDSVGDKCDKCPDTKTSSSVNDDGCSDEQITTDTDNDGMPDDWEDRYGLDKRDPDDADEDLDRDGMSNYEEYIAGTDPSDKNSSPRKIEPPEQNETKVMDSDNDGMPDDWEIENGLDPDDPSDAEEDLDDDKLTNIQEFSLGTSPTEKDTDNDGYTDKRESDAGTDPLDPNSHPRGGFFKTFLLILIILILLGVIGYIGYMQIPKYLRKKSQSIVSPIIAPPMQPPRPRLNPDQQRLLMQRMTQRRSQSAQKRREVMSKFTPAETLSEQKHVDGIIPKETEAKKTEQETKKVPIQETPQTDSKPQLKKTESIKESPKSEEKEDVFKRLAKISKK